MPNFESDALTCESCGSLHYNTLNGHTMPICKSCEKQATATSIYRAEKFVAQLLADSIE